ncbi:glycoside hydrolase family 16 protein [Poronia punctata]|nr:glycoside hydrolase family 16 protein [Poronia punctata]
MAYSLSSHFSGQGFLDSFTFFTGRDLNNGFVDYQSREDALAKNLVSIDEFNRVKLGVDSVHTYSTNDTGRPSVRLTSKDAFTHGLFIADFAHMPGSTCGTWPSFWAFNNYGNENDTSWPKGGELDIVEGANTAQRNLISAHTTPGCEIPSSGFTGVPVATDCSLSPGNIGCNYAAPTADASTYGDAFNAEGGGVYALEWDSDGIRIWHFPRSAIPDNVNRAPLPDPTTWGPPQALFGGSKCDVDSYFYNMSLVINTNFCGDYAGEIWGITDQCNKLAPTCEEYVAANPRSFNNAFWQINYIDVYRKKPARTRENATLPLSSPVVPSGTRTVTITTTSSPTPTNQGLAGPATLPGWTRLGCFGGYKSLFSEAGSSETMDIEACVASCTGRGYAGVSGTTCYCADTLGKGTTAVENQMCNTPCPGNPHESCGGTWLPGFGFIGIETNHHNTTIKPRTAPSNILLTIYSNNSKTTIYPPGAPAKNNNNNNNNTTTTTKPIVTLTITYTTINPTNPAKLLTLEYCTTGTNTVVVPMKTRTETCAACGPHGENTVTLTFPAAAATATVFDIAVKTVLPLPFGNGNRSNSSSSISSSSFTFTGGAAGRNRGLSSSSSSYSSFAMLMLMFITVSLWFCFPSHGLI